VIHEQVAHGSRGNAKKVGPTRRLTRTGGGESEIGLMHEVGRLQRMSGSLSPEQPRGDDAKLVVDQGEELVGCRGVTRPDGGQQARYFACCWVIGRSHRHRVGGDCRDSSRSCAI